MVAAIMLYSCNEPKPVDRVVMAKNETFEFPINIKMEGNDRVKAVNIAKKQLINAGYPKDSIYKLKFNLIKH